MSKPHCERCAALEAEAVRLRALCAQMETEAKDMRRKVSHLTVENQKLKAERR